MKCYDEVDLGLLVNGLFYFEFRDFTDDDYDLMCSKLNEDREMILKDLKK